MKRIVIAVISLFIFTGIAAPVHGLNGAAKKYPSCADLLKKYPNGVAKNKKARYLAVQGGFAKPKISKSLYKKNSGRLDPDKDGVVCEVSSSNPVEPFTFAKNIDVSLPAACCLLPGNGNSTS